MEFIKNNWFNLLLIIIVLVIFIFIKKKLRDKDAVTDYSTVNLRERFNKMNSGETWLMFYYDKMTEPRKKEYILNQYYQDMEVSNERGYKYIISELISDKYYDIEYNSEGKVSLKTGPYIAYKVIPKTEKRNSNINIKDINGPVQVATEGSVAYQHTENSSFSSKVEEYKELMMRNGISEEDINAVIDNPNDEYVKKSFLSRYGLELAKISVNVAGVVVNLLKLFQS